MTGAALTDAPEPGTWVWFAGRYIPEPQQHVWGPSAWQLKWLEQGQYFSTREDAQAAMEDMSDFGALGVC